MSDVAHKNRTKLDPQLRKILEDAPKPSKRMLRCASCKHPITSEETRIQMQGNHGHYFSNPYGFQFHVGCFSHAPGCTISGKPNHADTWFPGFLWRLASCLECQTHLGWSFENPAGDLFYGLILPRLQQHSDEQ